MVVKEAKKIAGYIRENIQNDTEIAVLLLHV